jgi:glycine cleavage system regulatory protein
MATLTVTANEKDIRTPASASQTEEINTGIETDDVESARAAAIKSIDDVKGRIVESTLQKLEAGQFAAHIVAEVAPESAGQVVDRLKQLGKMARLDIQRRQTTDPSKSQSGVQAPVRIELAPTKLIISMYNLANVAPRLTTNLNLAGDDVESIYRAILKRVADAGGRVVVSNLNRSDATNVTGSMQFEVKSADADAVLNDIRKDVQVLRLAVNENPDTANVTTAKQAFTVQVIPTAQVPPRQTRSLSVQISDVEVGMQSINAALAGVGARLSDSNLQQDAEGRSVARLGIDVPLGKVEQLLDVARKLGRVRVSESSENPQVPEGPLARARINLVLGSGETIIPAQGGFWSSIREGLSTSVKGLMWSLELIVIGLCLVGPWVGLVWGGWRLAKRSRGQKAEGRAQRLEA